LRLGDELEHIRDFVNIEPHWTDVLRALLKLVLVTLSGVYFVARFFAQRTRLGFLASSFLVGPLLTTLFYVGLRFVGVKATEPVQWGFLLAGSLPGCVYLALHHGDRFQPGPGLDLSGTIAVVLVTAFFALLFRWKFATSRCETSPKICHKRHCNVSNPAR